MSSPSAKPDNALRIAIDGPAGAGKSTVARRVADQLGYLYIDTGAMYRSASWFAQEHGLLGADGDTLAKAIESAGIDLVKKTDGSGLAVIIAGQDVSDRIRTPEISQLVSSIAALPPVRRLLVRKQREISERGGIVLDGRDIGTVVIPDADLKVFLTASPEIRAARRLKDLESIGEPIDFKKLLDEINKRDQLDSTRADSPLRMASDAIEIDTDNMTIDMVVDKIVALCQISE